METNLVVKGLIVPGKPQPLLAPGRSPAWQATRDGFEKARQEIEKSDADLLILYSTQWPSVIGHQIQADPEPKWVHVDPEFHDLGTMPYEFRMDAAYAEAYETSARKRGLHARRVNYRGFPIDTGTIVALKLLNPKNRLKACVVSSNMYADRAETIVLGKAAHDALQATGKKAIAVAVTSLSNRYFSKIIDPKEDRIYSLKDDEWNRKILEILAEGRLEDVSQLAREFSQQASGDSKMKAVWWLAALMGQHNRYEGTVYSYQPIWGTGAAVVSLTPSAKKELRKEFDEEDVEVFKGTQSVLGNTGSGAEEVSSSMGDSSRIIKAKNAPSPVGSYPHARREGNLLYLSGIGPRRPGTNEIPGGPIKNERGEKLNYDIEAQTRSVIENVSTILKSSGSSLEKVIDVQVFLVDMERDFKIFNKVYSEYFANIQATRTTVAVSALPTPIAVEFKVIARA